MANLRVFGFSWMVLLVLLLATSAACGGDDDTASEGGDAVVSPTAMPADTGGHG